MSINQIYLTSQTNILKPTCNNNEPWEQDMGQGCTTLSLVQFLKYKTHSNKNSCFLTHVFVWCGFVSFPFFLWFYYNTTLCQCTRFHLYSPKQFHGMSDTTIIQSVLESYFKLHSLPIQSYLFFNAKLYIW